MTQPNLPALGAEMIAQSSPVSRPSPPGGLRPALTPAADSTGLHRSGAGQKEDQQIKIRLTEVSTVRGDCLGPDSVTAVSGRVAAGIVS
jgi:hypothetical protein